jgi:hypothetical protein
MATDVTALSATITASTPIATPQIVELNIGSVTVNKIRWRVPPGPRGNLGWYLSMGGVQVLPDDKGAYVIADDEYDDWQIDNLPDSGAWELTGYNTGTHDHTVYLYFFTTPIVTSVAVGGDLLAGFPQFDTQIPGLFLT